MTKCNATSEEIQEYKYQHIDLSIEQIFAIAELVGYETKYHVITEKDAEDSLGYTNMVGMTIVMVSEYPHGCWRFFDPVNDTEHWLRVFKVVIERTFIAASDCLEDSPRKLKYEVIREALELI